MGMVLSTAILGVMMTITAGAAGTEMEFDLPEEKLIRNEDGNVVGVDVSDIPFDTTYENYTLEQLLSTKQFKEYEKLGLTYDEGKDSKELYFAGMVVMDLVDEYKKGTILQYVSDAEDDLIPDPDYPGYVKEKWSEPEYSDKKLVSVTAVRDEEYRLLYFEFADIADSFDYQTSDSYPWEVDESSDVEYYGLESDTSEKDE